MYCKHYVDTKKFKNSLPTFEPYKWKSQNLVEPYNKNLRNPIIINQTKSKKKVKERDHQILEVL